MIFLDWQLIMWLNKERLGSCNNVHRPRYFSFPTKEHSSGITFSNFAWTSFHVNSSSVQQFSQFYFLPFWLMYTYWEEKLCQEVNYLTFLLYKHLYTWIWSCVPPSLESWLSHTTSFTVIDYRELWPIFNLCLERTFF